MVGKIFKIFFLLLFIPFSVDAGSVGESQKAVIETANAYLRQGVQYQYDSFRKNLYATPEDATPQHTIYTVCSGFVYQTYYQALGIKLPVLTRDLFDYAKKYQNDKSIVMRYYGTAGEIYTKNVFGTKDNPNYSNLVKEWINFLQPGDVFVIQTTTSSGSVAGHAMLVEEIDYQNGIIYMLESSGGKYDYEKHVDKYESKGTINRFNLEDRLKSNYEAAYKTNNSVRVSQMTLLRFINDNLTYIDIDGNTTNYGNMTSSAISRLKYPQIDIEKIVNIKNDYKTVNGNNGVNLGEYITFEITIKNNSNSNYPSMTITENIDSKVKVSNKGGGSLNNGKLKWTISSLSAGATKKISYTVYVPTSNKNLLGKVIFSTGSVDNIATSKIEILIGNKLTKSESDKLKEYINSHVTTGTLNIDFINSEYSKALSLSTGLKKLSDFMVYDDTQNTSGLESLFVLKTTIKSPRLKSYVYSNYYGLRLNAKNNSSLNLVRYYNWNNFPKNEIYDRARTILPSNLDDGDVILVYTGVNSPSDTTKTNKAYIYFDGTLKRKTSKNIFEQISGDNLITFLRNLAGENYAILRPALLIDREYSEDNFVESDEDNKKEEPSKNDNQDNSNKEENKNTSDKNDKPSNNDNDSKDNSTVDDDSDIIYEDDKNDNSSESSSDPNENFEENKPNINDSAESKDNDSNTIKTYNRVALRNVVIAVLCLICFVLIYGITVRIKQNNLIIKKK